MTLTYGIDLDILPLDLHTKEQVCTFVCSAMRVFTDRQTHTHTDDVKTITPVADAGRKNGKVRSNQTFYSFTGRRCMAGCCTLSYIFLTKGGCLGWHWSVPAIARLSLALAKMESANPDLKTKGIPMYGKNCTTQGRVASVCQNIYCM